MPSLSLLLLMMLRNSNQQLEDTRTLRQRMSAYARRRRDRRIRRRALQQPSFSAFTVLFGSGCDQSLITLTGFDHQAFRYLLEKFTPVYTSYTPYSSDGMIRRLPVTGPRRGRPRSLTALQCLGLALAWGRTRGSEMVLCMLFGITGSVCSLFLRYGRRILLKVLCADPQAAVRMPTEAEVSQFKEAFCSKYSLLTDVYCVADGLKLHLEQSGDCIIQNMFYNGWTHDHYVSNVFVFAPNGVIISCAINAPGSMHDSTIAEWGSVYDKLEELFERCGGRCVVDSAFSKGNYPFLIKSSQDHLIITDNFDEIILLRQATSALQTSEWGMRSFQATFLWRCGNGASTHCSIFTALVGNATLIPYLEVYTSHVYNCTVDISIRIFIWAL